MSPGTWVEIGTWVSVLVPVSLAELFEQPVGEGLQSPANPVFAGKSHCQPEGQQGNEKGWRHGNWVSFGGGVNVGLASQLRAASSARSTASHWLLAKS